MKYNNKFRCNTKEFMLSVVVDLKGKVSIPEGLGWDIYKSLDYGKYLVTIKTSNDLPLTKNGIPFGSLKYIVKLNTNEVEDIGPNMILGNVDKLSIINSKNCLDKDDIIFWHNLKSTFKDRICSSDLLEHGENTINYEAIFDLCLTFTKI